MIISRAPYRVSFFGGGTDYPEWYEKYGGVFLSTAIDHHVTLVLRSKPSLDRFRYRVVWRELEDVGSVDDIQHPFVRAALKKFDFTGGLDVVYFGDLPHGAGIGSSSSFGVAFTNGLYALKGKEITPYDLAMTVYDVERNHLKDTVGIQDQIACSFGGFNFGRIGTDGRVSLERINLSTDRKAEFSDRLIFVFTGKSRYASEMARAKVQNIGNKEAHLRRMTELAFHAKDVISSDANLDEFGELLHESWCLKRDLHENLAPKPVNDLYDLAMASGAIGGKLLGAGGGGFMVFFVPEGRKKEIEKKLSDYVQVPATIDAPGPNIVLNKRSPYFEYYDRIWQKTSFNGIGPGDGRHEA